MHAETHTLMQLLPHAQPETAMSLFKKILVPIDGSKTSDKALDYALRLAKDGKGQVRLVHCIDDLSFLNGHEYSGELMQIARENGNRILQTGTATAKAMGVATDHVLIDRVAQRLGDSVADAAGDWGADLIVIGTHGRRGIGRVLLGSGSEQIMRLSPVPVLMIRGFD
jgi:nucleotide-binding universal stress UspA family protein